MAHSTTAGTERQIDPDQIVRIEISRGTSAEDAQVRVFVADAGEPYSFDFKSMSAAIEFYEHLWSLRTATESADTSNIA